MRLQGCRDNYLQICVSLHRKKDVFFYFMVSTACKLVLPQVSLNLNLFPHHKRGDSRKGGKEISPLPRHRPFRGSSADHDPRQNASLRRHA